MARWLAWLLAPGNQYPRGRAVRLLGFSIEEALLDWSGKLKEFADEAHVPIRTGDNLAK